MKKFERLLTYLTIPMILLLTYSIWDAHHHKDKWQAVEVRLPDGTDTTLFVNPMHPYGDTIFDGQNKRVPVIMMADTTTQIATTYPDTHFVDHSQLKPIHKHRKYKIIPNDTLTFLDRNDAYIPGDTLVLSPGIAWMDSLEPKKIIFDSAIMQVDAVVSWTPEIGYTGELQTRTMWNIWRITYYQLGQEVGHCYLDANKNPINGKIKVWSFSPVSERGLDNTRLKQH